MLETKVFVWRIAGTHEFIPVAGMMQDWNINLYMSEVTNAIGEGWQPVSHAVTPVGDDFLLTILVSREALVPDDASALGGR